jgi:hypothetical protein
MDKFTTNNRSKQKYQIVQHLKSILSYDFGSACITNTSILGLLIKLT